MSAPTPRLSLVVSTRNRSHGLPRALGYLSAIQARDPWELIVVDNGSTDGTWRLLSEFQAASPLDITLVREPRAGLSRARNTGWRAARGEIVCFTDDDCYAQPDLIEAFSTVFGEAELGFVGGRVLLFDPQDAPITIQPSENRRDIPARSYVPAGVIHGANFAFRRALLEAAGGFDERLGAGTSLPSGEDVDMLSRVSAAGHAGAYDPRPTVLHHHGRRDSDEIDRLRRGYDMGRGAYFLKCLVDSRRRGPVVRPMLRSLGHSLLAAWRRPQEMLPRLYELEGAGRYVVSVLRSPRA